MISPTFIRDYLVEKFKTDGKLVSDGAELVIPSIFIPGDYQGHMSINLDTGLWQCFKSKERGNFLKLYTILEGVTYGKAKGEVSFNSYLSKYNPKEDDLAKANIKKEKFDFNKFLEEDCSLVKSSPANVLDKSMIRAIKFLKDRCLIRAGKFYLCKKGAYEGRLIIPFELEKKVVFFQARALSDRQVPKYLNFKGMKCSDILYPFDMDAEDLYVTEGVLCCKTLKSLGFNATCINGSFVSREQAYQLKQFEGRLIMAMDNDEAGRHCIATFNKTRKDLMMPAFWIVTPDKQSKDWNEQYVMGKPIRMDAKLYDWTFPILTEL
tara:strand:+ start:25436 stop:26401 length:966 start_codon:yes stop_codon:yes gene_type:complete